MTEPASAQRVAMSGHRGSRFVPFHPSIDRGFIRLPLLFLEALRKQLPIPMLGASAILRSRHDSLSVQIAQFAGPVQVIRLVRLPRSEWRKVADALPHRYGSIGMRLG